MHGKLLRLLGLAMLLTGCGLQGPQSEGFKPDPQKVSKREVSTLEIGAHMPPFKLISTEDQYFESSELRGAKASLVVFMSNYCPTSQAYEQRIMDIDRDYQGKGLRIVAISPNSPTVIPLEAMGYSDLGDDFASMRHRDTMRGFDFPYLYDGDDHQVSLQFGPTAIPHVFLFDRNQMLRYRGNIDGRERPGQANGERLRNAIDAVLEGREIIRNAVDVYGCDVQWAWRQDQKLDKDSIWNIRPIGLEEINLDSLRTMMINFGPRVRLINFWATWCGPCKLEFPELVKMQRMYGERRFEFLSVSLDAEEQYEDALTFLNHMQSALANFICYEPNKEKLAKVVHPNWDGTLPFTIILEPYGEVYRYWQGPIDPLEVKKAVVDHRLMGRFY